MSKKVVCLVCNKAMGEPPENIADCEIIQGYCSDCIDKKYAKKSKIMTREWGIMGIHPTKGNILIAEADTLEAASLLIKTGIIKNEFKNSIINWVVSKKQYEENYKKECEDE